MPNLDKIYSKKQQEVLRYAVKHDFFMLINHGAKRSGKTILDNDLFLMELKRVRKIADKEGVKNPQYILAGSDLSSLQRNVLTELTNRYGLEFKFDKANRFKLFGVTVCCFGHSKINDLGRIRGMTAYGAYINEATMANELVFNEIRSRCSGTGARLIMDTNPDRPSHPLKRDFIDKADGKTIVEFHWELTDNTFLDKRYIQSIIDSTPSGMFTDRDIKGLWVSAQGIVYPDFNAERCYVTEAQLPPMQRHWVGVDFGWEHYGAMVLLGEGTDGIIYVLEEKSGQFIPMTSWIEYAKSLKQRFGDRLLFYCDSARPDRIDELAAAGIYAMNAKKDVVAGISHVATLFKQGRLKVLESGVDRFKEEIERYSWSDKADEPVKEWDDVLDAVRYAVYTDHMLDNGRR